MKLDGKWAARAEKQPMNTAILVFLIALICISLPLKWLAELTGEMTAMLIPRYIFAAFGVFLIIMYGFGDCLKPGKAILRNFDIVLVCLIVAVNNFPIIGLIRGEVVWQSGAGLTTYFFFNLSVGFFEEVYFRGLIFALMRLFFRRKRHCDLISIIISSAAFGLVHIVNLISGAGFGSVIMQIGYSTLIGALASCALYFTKSIYIPVLTHTLFNFGGLLTDYDIVKVMSGASLWNTPTIILTVVVGVLAAAYLVFRFIRYNYFGENAEAWKRAEEEMAAEERAEEERAAEERAEEKRAAEERAEEERITKA